MFRRPELEEVMEYGRAVGLNLTPTEARVIGSCLIETIASLEAFYESRRRSICFWMRSLAIMGE